MVGFLKKNKIQLLIVFVVGIFAYSIKLGMYSVSIDTEILIYHPEAMLKSWIAIGRWGLVAVKNLFHFLPINIILTNICAFLIFFISIMVWFANLDKISKKENKFAKTIFGLIVITAPIFAEQFYFSLQSVEVAIAFLGLAIAVFFQEKWITNNKVWAIFPAVLFVTYAFGCYQAFIPLYISVCVFDYIVKYDGKINMKQILKYLLIFGISFILNVVIDRMAKNIYGVHDSGYLKNQILWGTERKYITITRILHSISNSFMGIGYHETLAYGIAFVLMTIVVAEKRDFYKNKFFYLAYMVFFVVAPFATTILKGTIEAARARFVIPFVTGFALYYVLSNTENKKILKLAKITAIYAIIVQTVITFSLFYIDNQRYHEDVKIANKIEEDLKNYDSSKLIVFMGAYQTPETIIKGETIGASFFAHDAGSNLGCTHRALGFMKTLGMNHELATVEQIQEAREELSAKVENKEINLTVYPNEGYIIELDNYIIVNF